MTMSRLRFAFAALGLALTTPLSAQQTEAPAPLPLEPVEFPAFQERTLSNGARLLVVRNDCEVGYGSVVFFST